MNKFISFEEYVKRLKQLAGIKSPKNTYLVKITFETNDLLLEYECLQNFKGSNNRYLLHPESKNPPVKAHYHVYPSKGKNEIYAVNMDGTAHHRANKGYVIPRKEAEELKSFGVNIKDSRIIEYVDFLDANKKQLLTESIKSSNEYVFLKFEE